MMETPAIGIDLGTTYSCVGVWQQGKVEIIANDQGNRITPSLVAFSEDERLIGDAAKIQVAINPKNSVFDAKRLIGRKFTDPNVQSDMKHWPFTVINDNGKPKVCAEFKGEEKQFAPEEISSMVLSKMKEIAEAFLDGKVTDAVITVPAYFNDSQRQATKDAGTIAGLNVLRIINEPTAATLAYGLDKGLKGKKNVLTFDLGGGTFDVSIVTVEEGSLFEVKSTAGDTHLGGEDFDNRLVNHLAEEFKRKFKIDPMTNPRAVCRLRAAAERAKCTLSCSSSANIVVDSLMDGIDFHTKITRPKFEALCSDLFEATLTPVQKALDDAKLVKTAIDDVVLVGGSTRIPKVQSLLRNFFHGKDLKHSLNPDEAVAYGAAVQAAILKRDSSLQIQDLVLMDVTPLSLGIGNKGGIMRTIIPRNSTIPCSQTGKDFTTSMDNQTGFTISVYEGERAMAIDNNLLGTFYLDGPLPKIRGVAKLDITFDLDADGILKVSAIERCSGISSNIVIENEGGRLSKEDIGRLIKEAKKFKEEDARYRARDDARIKLEDYIYDIKHKVERNRSKLSNSDQNFVKDKCVKTIEWLDNNPSAGLGEYFQKLQEIQKECAPFMTKFY